MDILRSICTYLKPRDICKLARLTKKHSEILYDNQIWKKLVWNIDLTENKMQSICNNPLFRINAYKYCLNYHICQLESIIYTDQIYSLWEILNTTQPQLWVYINTLQAYYIICENPDREFLYKLYFNYSFIFGLIEKISPEILKETYITNLLFQEFYYMDEHVIIRQHDNIVINNNNLISSFLKIISDSEWPLHQLIKLFANIQF